MAQEYFEKALEIIEDRFSKESSKLIPVYQGLGTVGVICHIMCASFSTIEQTKPDLEVCFARNVLVCTQLHVSRWSRAKEKTQITKRRLSTFSRRIPSPLQSKYCSNLCVNVALNSTEKKKKMFTIQSLKSGHATGKVKLCLLTFVLMWRPQVQRQQSGGRGNSSSPGNSVFQCGRRRC